MYDTIDQRKLAVSDFIWDMFSHKLPPVVFQSVQEKMGLHPSDPDGLDFQHKQADKRKESFSQLEEVNELFSSWAGEVVTEYTLRALQAHGADIKDLPPDMRAFFNKQNGDIIQMGAQSVIMRLLDKGVLKYGDKLES